MLITSFLTLKALKPINEICRQKTGVTEGLNQKLNIINTCFPFQYN